MLYKYLYLKKKYETNFWLLFLSQGCHKKNKSSCFILWLAFFIESLFKLIYILFFDIIHFAYYTVILILKGLKLKMEQKVIHAIMLHEFKLGHDVSHAAENINNAWGKKT